MKGPKGIGQLVPGPVVAALASEYVAVLAGADIRGSLRSHAIAAGINTRYFPWDGSEQDVALRMILAAAGQSRLREFILAASADGIDLPTSRQLATNDVQEVTRLPAHIEVISVAPFVPSGPSALDPRLILLTARIVNASDTSIRVTLVIRVSAAQDEVTTSIDVPPGGTDVPAIRMPRFTADEATALGAPATLGTVTIRMFLAGAAGPLDTVQQDIWLLQPDVALLFVWLTSGELLDYTASLAWWVNPSAKGLRAQLARELSANLRNRFAYVSNDAKSTFERRDSVALAKGVFCALQGLNMRYLAAQMVSLPDSWSVLQRVQPPDVTLDHPTDGVNCLDAAVLLCSAFEHVGLHPILLLTPGHAVAGWKYDPRPLDIRSAEAIWSQCGFVDATFLTTQSSFEIARSAAEGIFVFHKDRISAPPGGPDNYACVVDVRYERGRKGQG